MLFFKLCFSIILKIILLQNLLSEAITATEPDDQPAINDTLFEPKIDIRDEFKLILQENLTPLKQQIQNLTQQNREIKEINQNLQNELKLVLENFKNLTETSKTQQQQETNETKNVAETKTHLENDFNTKIEGPKAKEIIARDEPERIQVLTYTPYLETNSEKTLEEAIHKSIGTKAFIEIPENCKDNKFFSNCDLIIKANYCSHKYYKVFCCHSCAMAGLLPPSN